MKTRYVLAAAAAVAALGGWGLAQSSTDAMEQGFRNPPDSARPRTWWHWTNGNVTRDGITKDLEWMKRAGIGGFQLADVAAGQGQTVEHKIFFGTPEWYDALRHAAAEADRLGLEMAIFSSPGWSETGGPWVKPEGAMKKLVWSVTTLEGPRSFTGKLPQPPSNNGPILDLKTGGRGGNSDPTFYGDTAVLAYPTPRDEVAMADFGPKITASSGPIDAAPLLDDDLNTSATIPAGDNGGPAWLQFEFARPFPARAISLGGRGIPVGRLLASDDGTSFRTLMTLPGPQGYHGALLRTFAFPETTARFFRLELTAAPLSPAAVINGGPIQPAKQFTLTEAKLLAGGRVNRWEDKGGFSSLMDEYETSPTPAVAAAAAIGRAGEVNLTAKMSPDGTLTWDIPAGHWTVLRIGYSLTGAKNRPAVASGLGSEADKLSVKHMEEYYHGYIDPIAQALGPLMGKGLRYVMMDSWEAGMQNWTEDFPAEFRKLRGYDMTPYLPVLTGRIVENSDVSDRFLWDFRRTLADLYADAHYGTMAAMLRQRGIGVYAEASGVALEILEDSLLNKSKVEIPMAEFWVHALHPEPMYYMDVRGAASAASAAHVYNKPIVATESFTGGGYEAPFLLKKVADYWFAQGVNRLVFHTSAHQPLDTRPGNTMVGTHIHRNITWAEQARPLMDYFARTSFMLQQGHSVADFAYLLREGAPSTMPFWGAGVQPAVPEGYDYDFVNTDVLLNRMAVAPDGRLTLPGGMSYRVLVLPEIHDMTVPVARKIRDLAAAGATVLGPRPTHSPSLAGYPDADREVQAIATDVWGDADCVMVTQHAYGKGRVACGKPPAAAAGGAKDFDASRPLGSDLVWAHRTTAGADIYYVANLTDRSQSIEARFRVKGKAPELWHADTGAIETTDYSDGGDVVPLRLAERESVFVVFRHDAAAPERITSRKPERVLAAVDGPWDVTFPQGLGAPANVRFPKLESWTAGSDDGVKYFSGTATYHKSIEAPASWFRGGDRLVLDLGGVKDLAEVTVNGKALGIEWKPPYEADVTTALKPGRNQIEVKVTNEWTNRLIGDRLHPDRRVFPAPPGAGGRGGFGFGPQQPLESGLLGPVRVLAAEGYR